MSPCRKWKIKSISPIIQYNCFFTSNQENVQTSTLADRDDNTIGDAQLVSTIPSQDEVNKIENTTEVIVEEIVPADDAMVTMVLTSPTITIEFPEYQENIVIKNTAIKLTISDILPPYIRRTKIS